MAAEIEGLQLFIGYTVLEPSVHYSIAKADRQTSTNGSPHELSNRKTRIGTDPVAMLAPEVRREQMNPKGWTCNAFRK